MKGQSLLIQFVLFFLVGLTLFLSIGSFFRLQSDMFRESAAESSVKLINSYLSSLAIASVDTCKECDSVRMKVETEERFADYFIEVTLDDYGLEVSTVPRRKYFISPIHNLNETVNLSGRAPLVRAINLTYNRNKNKLEVK